MHGMRFDVITLFPEIIESYCAASIVGRAQHEKIIAVKAHNLRVYGEGRHQQVDDKPYGGGAGMILKAGPIITCVDTILKRGERAITKTILFSAKGKPFTHRLAVRLSKHYQRLILICGRYEGIDERVKAIMKAEEVSLGPYVLTDGDIPALAVISAVTRLLPGVITLASLVEESFSSHQRKKGRNATLEYPHYTRPEALTYKGRNYRVPKVLLSGNHRAIEGWRETHRSAARKSK